MKRLYLSSILSSVLFTAYSQNMEEIGLDKGVRVNGSVNLSAVGYYAHGIEQRRDPLNWFATGNINLNLFGYSAPFSFSYSNANSNFSQPFNQFSFQPQYKWLKTYVGYNSMTFSNYTLAGHVFLGGGVDLSPGKWRISAMYGRLKKAVPFDLADSLQYNAASYKRMGYGLKVGYDDNGNVVEANVFTAKDDIHSIPFVLQESGLAPMQNLSLGVHVRKTFLKKFFVDAEYAISALNTDARATTEQDTVLTPGTSNFIKGLLPENATARYYDAINASIGYHANWYTFQFKYERIAPEYQTLGAYFFNNDMQNITVVPSVRLMKNTLNLSANVGLQQNNLDQSRASTTSRTVGSLNVNYLPNEFWNLVVNYSNFSSYTNVRPQHDPFFQNSLDTLNFYQVSQTTNATIVRTLGTSEKPQSIMLNLSYQIASDNAAYDGGDQQSAFISSNVAYSFSLVPSGTTVSISANLYKTNATDISSTYCGPTLSLTKSLMERQVRASLASSYNETSGQKIEASPVLNNRISLTYTPQAEQAGGQSPHNVSLGINILNRLKATEQQRAFSEYTANFNYTYTF